MRHFLMLTLAVVGLCVLPMPQTAAQDMFSLMFPTHDADILNLKPNFDRLAARGEIGRALTERMNKLSIMLGTEQPPEAYVREIVSIRADFPGLHPAIAPWLVFLESRLYVAAGDMAAAEKAVGAWAHTAPPEDADLAGQLRYYLARIYAEQPEHTGGMALAERLDKVRELAGGVFRDRRVAGLLRLFAGLYLADQVDSLNRQQESAEFFPDDATRRQWMLAWMMEKEDILREAGRLCNRMEAALGRAKETSQESGTVSQEELTRQKERIDRGVEEILQLQRQP